jgi:hypothetical protein
MTEYMISAPSFSRGMRAVRQLFPQFVLLPVQGVDPLVVLDPHLVHGR